MAVNQGYKQTAVGVIPDDWCEKTLREVSLQITDGDHITPRRTSQGYYLLSARNIRNGYVDLSDVDYVGQEEFARMRTRCAPVSGDILVSCSGNGLGRVAIVPIGLHCVLVRSAALIKAEPRKSNSSFLHHWLRGRHAQNQIANGLSRAAQPNLFLGSIQQIRAPLPPTLAEQEAIAGALSDADAWIESLEQLIAKKRQIKQGAMQELLTGKRRLPGFEVKRGYKQSDLGLIPEDWQNLNVADVTTKVGSGITPKGGDANYRKHGRPFIRSQNVGWGRLLLDDLAFIDDNMHSTFASTETCEGDVLLNITGASIGRSAVVDRFIAKGNVNQHVCILRPKRQLCNSKFLNGLLLSPICQKQIDSFQAGGNRQGLNFGQIRALKIPLPSTLAEQQAIASVLSDMDTDIYSLESKLAKAREIKQGMMQELLTGRIRLV